MWWQVSADSLQIKKRLAGLDLDYIHYITDHSSRPEAIDLSTVNRLIVDKKATIPFIVEGANLFLTQDAKLKLEKGLAVVFKDASVS